jgi:hypothetical protein
MLNITYRQQSKTPVEKRNDNEICINKHTYFMIKFSKHDAPNHPRRSFDVQLYVIKAKSKVLTILKCSTPLLVKKTKQRRVRVSALQQDLDAYQRMWARMHGENE